MKKRTICMAAAAIILMFSVGVTASASMLRASQYLSSYSAWGSANGCGSVSFSFDVTATSLSDKVGATQVVIQRKSGSSWVTAQTYNSNTRASLLGSDCVSHGDTITYSGTSGQQYRAVVTCYAEKNGGSDSRTATSNMVTA